MKIVKEEDEKNEAKKEKDEKEAEEERRLKEEEKAARDKECEDKKERVTREKEVEKSVEEVHREVVEKMAPGGPASKGKKDEKLEKILETAHKDADKKNGVKPPPPIVKTKPEKPEAGKDMPMRAAKAPEQKVEKRTMKTGGPASAKAQLPKKEEAKTVAQISYPAPKEESKTKSTPGRKSTAVHDMANA